jgi:hypothetical protein
LERKKRFCDLFQAEQSRVSEVLFPVCYYEETASSGVVLFFIIVYIGRDPKMRNPPTMYPSMAPEQRKGNPACGLPLAT